MGDGAIRVIQPAPFSGALRPLGAGDVDTGVAVLAIILRFTIWVLLIIAALWVIREILAVVRGSRAGAPRATTPALAELELRYARGEVTRADYLARRADLAGLAQQAPPPA